MMERRLLLTTYKEKKAAFLLQNDRLIQVMLDSTAKYRIGDVYVGRVKNLVPGMKAAFVELAPGSVGFLPLSDFKPKNILNRTDAQSLKGGDELLVQISKEPLKTKEATLTCDISFAGNYLVLIPLSHGIHYSQKLSREEKNSLWETISGIVKDLFGDMDVFLQHYGMIVRTNAVSAKAEEIGHELHELFHKASDIMSVADKRTVFSCLYKEDSFYERIIKNYFRPDETEVVTDEQVIYDRLLHSNDVFASLRDSLRLYEEKRVSMYRLYGLEEKLQEALQKKVWLKCGGYLVIEPTEALTVIDVNSGKSCHGSQKMSQTAFHNKINAEAADEILHQLRLRNLSGIIIVDFLKTDHAGEEVLLERLKAKAKYDPVETMIVGTTALGLVEMTRKKTEASLYEKLGV